MKISAAVARVGISAEHAGIDRKIQALLKRKKEPSDLIQPHRRNKQIHVSIDIKM